MPIIITAVILIIVNILLWMLLFTRFRRLFTTDDIIANTRAELNRLIEDVNRNADRDVTLIDSRIKELKLLVAEADKHISLAKAELQNQESAKIFNAQLDSVVKGKRFIPDSGNVKQQNSGEYSQHQKSIKQEIVIQSDLFAEQKDDEAARSETIEAPENSNEVSKSVFPDIAAPITMITPKKDFKDSVRELYGKGLDVESIATKLSCSIFEVQFALEMLK